MPCSASLVPVQILLLCLLWQQAFNINFYSRSLFKQPLMFDSYIIILNSFRNMVKKQARCVKREAQTSACEDKESIFEECEEHSTIPVLQGVKKEEPTPKASPVKSITKERKERKKKVYDPEGRFSKGHKKRFFLFPFHYATQFPYSKISWEYWKPSGYFLKMAKFVSQEAQLSSKSGEQCKSFDQRQKKEIYTNVDLLEAAFLQLKQTPLDSQALSILTDYVKKMEEQSEYMSFIYECAAQDVELKLEAETPSCATEGRNTSVAISRETMADFISNDFYEEP